MSSLNTVTKERRHSHGWERFSKTDERDWCFSDWDETRQMAAIVGAFRDSWRVIPLITWMPPGRIHQGELFGERELRELFQDFMMKWRKETRASSSVVDKSMNQYYQYIIGLGKPAIRFILEELSRKPDHWFWALRSISRENPVHPEDAGDIAKMAESWLSWGKQKGYI